MRHIIRPLRPDTLLLLPRIRRFSACHKTLLLGPPIFAFISLQIPYKIRSLTIGLKKMSRKLMKTNLYLAATLLMAIFVKWLVYLGGIIL